MGHIGNAAFAVQLTVAIGLEVAIARRPGARQDVWWAVASVVALTTAFAIWTTGMRGHPWCDPDTLLQQHGAWHLLCAAAACLLFRHYAAERPREREHAAYD